MHYLVHRYLTYNLILESKVHRASRRRHWQTLAERNVVLRTLLSAYLPGLGVMTQEHWCLNSINVFHLFLRMEFCVTISSTDFKAFLCVSFAQNIKIKQESSERWNELSPAGGLCFTSLQPLVGFSHRICTPHYRVCTVFVL